VPPTWTGCHFSGAATYFRLLRTTSFLPLFPLTGPPRPRLLAFLPPASTQGRGHDLAAVTLCTILLISGLSATTSPPSSHPVRSFHTALCLTVTLHRQCFHFVLFQLTHAPYKRRAAMASNSTGIPLHCNICPKRPNFSDVSHLLTHIASKGHLSNYYKVKVRSSHEDASRRVIDAYDRWYAEWGVEELMSDRMNQKDKRRSRARPIGMASIPQRAAALWS
jgi:hypothetical protein